MDNKQEIWLTLAREKWPALTEDQAKSLSLKAANAWYMGEESELTHMFDQYVMLKNLKGM